MTDEQVAEIAQRAAALVSSHAEQSSPWLSVVEAAERLRCSRDRIYDLIQLGRLNPPRRPAECFCIATSSTPTWNVRLPNYVRAPS